MSYEKNLLREISKIASESPEFREGLIEVVQGLSGKMAKEEEPKKEEPKKEEPKKEEPKKEEPKKEEPKKEEPKGKVSPAEKALKDQLIRMAYHMPQHRERILALLK